MERDTDYLSKLDPEQLSEADTRAKLIDPVLKEDDWSEEESILLLREEQRVDPS